MRWSWLLRPPCYWCPTPGVMLLLSYWAELARCVAKKLYVSTDVQPSMFSVVPVPEHTVGLTARLPGAVAGNVNVKSR